MFKQGYYYYHQLKLLKRFLFTEMKLKIKNADQLKTIEALKLFPEIKTKTEF